MSEALMHDQARCFIPSVFLYVLTVFVLINCYVCSMPVRMKTQAYLWTVRCMVGI